MEKLSVLTRFCTKRALPFVLGAPLKELCTFKIGGPAAAIVSPMDEAQLACLLAFLKKHALRPLVLGKGSNMLFSDRGFDGVVIRIGGAFSGIRLTEDTLLECEAGASLTQVCRFAHEHALTGLEFAFGIPGSVGGAVYMNAGAYGGEMKDVLERVHHLTANGEQDTYEGDRLALSYRHSAYTDSDKVITKVFLRLAPGSPDEIRAKMDDYMNRRRSKQPLEFASAGSTFRRPEGAYASALIDKCGLKGRSVGGAVVSEKHAGFIVNTGEATGADVRALIEEVRREVKEKTGYDLACEVKIIGE